MKTASEMCEKFENRKEYRRFKNTFFPLFCMRKPIKIFNKMRIKSLYNLDDFESYDKIYLFKNAHMYILVVQTLKKPDEETVTLWAQKNNLKSFVDFIGEYNWHFDKGYTIFYFRYFKN